MQKRKQINKRTHEQKLGGNGTLLRFSLLSWETFTPVLAEKNSVTAVRTAT